MIKKFNNKNENVKNFKSNCADLKNSRNQIFEKKQRRHLLQSYRILKVFYLTFGYQTVRIKNAGISIPCKGITNF